MLTKHNIITIWVKSWEIYIWTPHVCVKPEDHVLQHDLRWTRAPSLIELNLTICIVKINVVSVKFDRTYIYSLLILHFSKTLFPDLKKQINLILLVCLVFQYKSLKIYEFTLKGTSFQSALKYCLLLLQITANLISFILIFS